MLSPRRTRSWKDPFLLSTKRTNIGQEVLAGVIGWMTVASSVAFCEYAHSIHTDSFCLGAALNIVISTINGEIVKL